ncbi:hypothetical protein LX32DRAFT_118953 [Colletotrichum zoysiae]|uniref:Uncharacterized protein n=1 Tax=Colletotrichum zoysiae TaxID=1216348 RepID=A0AAD9H876_9PEZI|nr:hypothetical protein LX32DRAFT_118953 [Colletotrichum zoysiae]
MGPVWRDVGLLESVGWRSARVRAHPSVVYERHGTLAATDEVASADVPQEPCFGGGYCPPLGRRWKGTVRREREKGTIACSTHVLEQSKHGRVCSSTHTRASHHIYTHTHTHTHTYVGAVRDMPNCCCAVRQRRETQADAVGGMAIVASAS